MAEQSGHQQGRETASPSDIEVYLVERKSLIEAQQESYKQFDKAILTLSSGGLGLSIIFWKEILPPGGISHRWFLIASWILFASSILSTLISFLTSQRAYKKQLESLESYFLKKDLTALKTKNVSALATELLNYASASLFILAIAGLIGFASANLPDKKSTEEGQKMSDDKSQARQGQVPHSISKAIGNPVLGDLTKGLVPPSLPQVPLSQDTPTQTAPSNPVSTDAKK
jgi:hypothetical protein